MFSAVPRDSPAQQCPGDSTTESSSFDRQMYLSHRPPSSSRNRRLCGQSAEAGNMASPPQPSSFWSASLSLRLQPMFHGILACTCEWVLCTTPHPYRSSHYILITDVLLQGVSIDYSTRPTLLALPSQLGSSRVKRLVRGGLLQALQPHR